MFLTYSLHFCLILKFILAQNVVKTLDEDYYVCVPPGYCDNNGFVSNDFDIDPRIVSPVDPQPAFCSNRQVPCFIQGTGSKCGERFITQTSTVDGIADPGAYPWQVYLENVNQEFSGSGVLLDNYHILTAAHKVYNDRMTPENIQALLGVFNPQDLTDVQVRDIASIIIHANFNHATLTNDLAILQLASPVSMSQYNINTACLPPAGTTFVGQRCVVAGWGQTHFSINDAPTNPMKQVYLNITDLATCRASFSNILGSNVDVYLDREGGEICAGGEAMKDACTDGGSPLLCFDGKKYYIVGLVIWGKGCGQQGIFGVYVNVPYYKFWIESNIV